MKRNGINSQVIFVALLLLVLSQVVSGAVVTGDDHYIVWPQDNEGGTFYLSQSADEVSNKYKRKGYIQALTPVYIDSDSLDPSNMLPLKEHDRSDRYPYYKFISATGVFGYVKDNSVKRLSDLAEKGGRSLIDSEYNNVIVPINPAIDVTLYQIKSANELVARSGFSRSAKMFVVSNLEKKQIKMPDGGYKELIAVKYWMELADGGYKEASAWVKSANRGVNFQVLPVSASESSVIRSKDESVIEKTMAIVKSWVSNYDDDQFERAIGKACGSEILLKATLKAELGGKFPIGFVRLSGAGDAEVSYLFPRNYRYSAAVFEDKTFNTNLRLLKTIRCKDNTSSDWFLEQLVLDGDFGGGVPQQFFHSYLIEAVKEYFRVPDLNGPLREREKMIELRDFSAADSAPDKDYYTAFYKLNQYIEGALSKDNISNDKRLRINQLLVEEMVGF